MKNNTLTQIIIAIFAMVSFSSCQDDYFDKINGVNGDGTGGVTLYVDYMPQAGAELKSRGTLTPPGDGMSTIEDMCFVIFDADGNFVKLLELGSGAGQVRYKDDNVDRTDNDASNGQLAGETSTIRRTINTTLDNGTFYLYAVSNLTTHGDGGVVTVSTKTYLESEGFVNGSASAPSRQDFRKMRRRWNPSNYRDNMEMTGCFTQSQQSGSSIHTAKTVEDDDEVPVRVYPGASLHCWLRRLSSKVTVEFDASGLNPSTTIYLKEMRVRDIPFDCSIVARNEATADRGKTGGLVEAANNSHKIQYCNDGADYTGKPEAVYKNWPALTASVNSLEKIQDFPDLKKYTHANDAPAIFFYENMQGDGESKLQDVEGGSDAAGNPLPDGVIDSPNSTDSTDPHYKDGKPAGTYVEVIAYYESTAEGNEGRGEIIYRFMLGANTVDNYDVERNHHYKLTLTFKGYANDYDWHVEYERAEVPVTIPNPYYISYGYNESLELPITIMGELEGDIKATIVRNDWWPSKQWEDNESDKDFHFDRTKVWYPTKDKARITAIRDSIAAVYRADKKPLNDRILKWNDQAYKEGVSLGFLSLRYSHDDALGGSLSAPTGDMEPFWNIWCGKEPDGSMNKYHGGRSLGERYYTIPTTTQTITSGENNDNYDGSYRVVVKPGTSKTPRLTTVYLPLYTRQRNIIKTTGYTGENPYNYEQRRAQVLYSFKVKDLNGISHNIDTIIDIVQVSKLGNPRGIWRCWNNAEPFDVTLKIPDMDEAGKLTGSYRDIKSQGGWSAEVEYGQDWIMLNGGKKKIFGARGSNISFTYRPSGILMNDKKVRCGIILVKYHNYTCTHRIFVRQGYAPIKVHDSGVYWHSFNMVTKNAEGDSPLDEGSMFRAGNWDDPISSENNVNDKIPWLTFNQNDFKDHENDNLVMAGGGTKQWWQIDSKSSYSNNIWDHDGNGDGYITFNGAKCRLLSIADVVRLRDGGENTYRYQYGIFYADGATEQANTLAEAYGYRAGGPKSYGMRGCVVYNRTNGRQIFLPIGSSGYGHRKKRGLTIKTPGGVESELGWANSPEVGGGVLRYAAGRITFMKSSDEAPKMPLLYDLFRRYGAVYWANQPEGDPKQSGNRSALDLNYYTFDFNTLGTEPFTAGTYSKNGTQVPYGSDACFIRLVQEEAP